ncbi:unnamed protein product [Pseudo-nitzschia multistriata]|uniref:Uncharacterized protein n=1 Tax=Pseudo-nitzschia multistriata TaxID=183589 RepID=A0A448YU69_9STRA|nr:unnamed protein product [Pseudo-nitzschia multistriata]
MVSLLHAGYTIEEIAKSIETANKIKSQRINSLRTATGRQGPLDFINGAVVAGKKSTKAIRGSMTAVMEGMRTKKPLLKKKLFTPPAG